MSSPKRMKVLVTSSEYPESGIKILSEKFEIIQSKLSGFEDKEANIAEIEKLIPGVDGIIWSTKVYLGKELLDKAGSQLKVVSAMSAGVDHIDINELKSRNIPLGNTPDVLNSAVADIAILLMISSSRRIKEGLEEVKLGKWLLGPQKRLGSDIKNSTVGIIGLGSIGQTIAKRVKAFEINKIIYTGPREKKEGKNLEAEYVSQNELYNQSDFIILSCPLNNNTRKMINSDAFSKMKKSAILINISRGEIVDQDALVDALKNNVIYAAGLDVTTPEPLPPDHPLIGLPNCFIIPHMGSATKQTRNEMAQLAALNAVLGLQGDRLLTSAY